MNCGLESIESGPRSRPLRDWSERWRRCHRRHRRSEEHTSELQSLMRISYAVFCLKKKKRRITISTKTNQYTQTLLRPITICYQSNNIQHITYKNDKRTQ